MSKTVYLLGAGVNRSFRTHDGLTPPLARDLFKQAFRHPRYSADFYQSRLQPLFSFIERIWRVDSAQLHEAEFDLEECYTFLELKRREAEVYGDRETLATATRLQFLLTDLLMAYLSEFYCLLDEPSPFRDLAAKIYETNAPVITFNYDVLLESQIERVSPHNQSALRTYLERERTISEARPALRASLERSGLSEREIRRRLYEREIFDEHVGFTPNLWNRVTAYQVQFDEVALLTPGPTQRVPGERFYNRIFDRGPHAPFLKLHGSLGWYFRSGYRIDGMPLEDSANAGGTVLTAPMHIDGVGNIDEYGEVLLPLIITPTLYKPYLDHPLLVDVWSKARTELTECGRLVIIGYSFPQTDYHVRYVLRDVFANRGPQELCIVNPDVSVIQQAQTLCNYRGPVLACADLAAYIEVCQ